MAKIDVELMGMSRQCANELAGYKPKNAQKRTGAKKKKAAPKKTAK